MIFTIGHGTRSIDELVAVLRSGPVRELIDVRRFPGSRRNPHLSRNSLEAALPEHGMPYAWWGEDLGGRRSVGPASRHPAWRVDAFRGYADHLDTRVARDAIVELEGKDGAAVMCAETLWWRCHRRLIADALMLRGTDVVHLIDEDTRQPHVLHPNVRAGDDGWPVYDVGTAGPLPLDNEPS